MNLPQMWGAYGRIQAELSRGQRINTQSWGAEAALDRILLSIQDNQPPSTEEIDRATATVCRRERHRAKLRLVYLSNTETSPSPEATVIAREGLNAVKSRVSGKDWAILSEMAIGRDYAELAASIGGTAGSMRIRVLRIRKKLAKAA